LKQLPPTAEERHRINDFGSSSAEKSVTQVATPNRCVSALTIARPMSVSSRPMIRNVPPTSSAPYLKRTWMAPRDVVSLAERVRIQAHDYFAFAGEFRYSERTVSLCADYPATGPIDIARKIADNLPGAVIAHAIHN